MLNFFDKSVRLWYVLLIVIMMLPVSVCAQEAMDNINEEDHSLNTAEEETVVQKHVTKQDNFGGWFLGAELHYGFEFGEGSKNWDEPLTKEAQEKRDSERVFYLNGMILLEAGYLWGHDFFIGPEVTFEIGWPYVVSGDVRLKIAAPFTDKDALIISLGVGMGLKMEVMNEPKHTFYKPVIDDNYSTNELSTVYELFYLPLSVGYEHVFGNGFVLGASLEARIGFGKKEIIYLDYSGDLINPDIAVLLDSGEILYDAESKETPLPYLHILALGIHLGYKF